jgi:hypothetical protein
MPRHDSRPTRAGCRFWLGRWDGSTNPGQPARDMQRLGGQAPTICKYPPAEPGALELGPLEAALRVADAALHSLAT